MQITFDPLVPAEVSAVARFLNRENEVVTLRVPVSVADAIKVASPDEVVTFMDDAAKMLHQPIGTVIQIERADQPDDASFALAQQSAPVAPLPAAADLFANAPAAAPAGVPLPPTASAPPAPTAPAPDAAPSEPAGPANLAHGVEVDKHGLPWDARIHASTKGKVADGSWRQRRNLDPGVAKAVEAELRALMAIPVGGLSLNPGDIAQSAAPLVPPAPAAVETGTTAGAPSAPIATAPAVPTPPTPAPSTPAPPVPPVPAPVASVSSEAPPLPPAPPTSAPATAAIPTPPVPPAPTAAVSTAPATGSPFTQLMAKIAREVPAGRLTETQVHEALEANGVERTKIGLLAGRQDLAAQVLAHINLIVGA